MAVAPASPFDPQARPRGLVRTGSLRHYFRLLPYAASEWRPLLASLVLTLFISATAALQPWPLKILVDYALGGAALPEVLRGALDALGLQGTVGVLIVAAAVASFALVAVNSALDSGLTWAWALAGERMSFALAADLFARLQRLSLLYHGRRPVGDSLNRITTDTWSIYTVVSALLVAPSQHLITIFTIGVVAWQLDPQLTVVLLLGLPALVTVSVAFGRLLKGTSRGRSEARSRLMAYVQQTLRALPLVQAYTAERRQRRIFRMLARDTVIFEQRDVSYKDVAGILNFLTNAIALAAVLYLGGTRTLSGALSLGSLLVFLAYARSLGNAFRLLAQTFLRLKAAEGQLEQVLDVLDSKEAVVEMPGARPLPLARAGHGRAVCFEQVTFGYTSGRPVLHDVCLAIAPGETLALVGPTGAGKTTLASLLPRFFDPWVGRVLLDGSDIRTLTLASVRAQIGLVLQEPLLFPISIAANIGYGRPGASREEIHAAAAAAGADGFISRLPRGYQTVLGEAGATLSGGERQRIAIARAILKQAPVLILDEPTAALDAVTEASVMAALGRLMRGRTTLIIAHRLSTVMRADRIAVLEGGRVRACGSHEQLLATDSRYASLVRRAMHGRPGVTSS